MKILAIEKESLNACDEDFKPYLESEAARVWELYQEGVIRELYFRQDRSEAVLMLECPDMRQAKEILASLPLVKAGLIGFEVMLLRPYSGFSRLFDSGSID